MADPSLMAMSTGPTTRAVKSARLTVAGWVANRNHAVNREVNGRRKAGRIDRAGSSDAVVMRT
jgi:hypothetical protein